MKSYNKLTKAGVRASATQQAGRREALLVEEGLRGRGGRVLRCALRRLPDLRAHARLNRLSQESDKAWLADEFERANKIISDYNKLDAKAVKRASALPASPDAAVAAAYAKAAEALTAQYYDARDKTLQADRALREY